MQQLAEPCPATTPHPTLDSLTGSRGRLRALAGPKFQIGSFLANTMLHRWLGVMWACLTCVWQYPVVTISTSGNFHANHQEHCRVFSLGLPHFWRTGAAFQIPSSYSFPVHRVLTDDLEMTHSLVLRYPLPPFC